MHRDLDPAEPRLEAVIGYSSPGHNDHDHFVQFYESDVFLIGSLARFIAPGIEGDEAVLVVATKEHREALERALDQAGCDLASAVEEGRYLAFDAAEMLARFMVDGHPDRTLFTQSVGALVAFAGENGRRVRIFGEMVALLWAAGNMSAAVELEELWNELAQAHPFILFCAYPLNSFDDDHTSEAFKGVSDVHGRVIPAENYGTLMSPDDRLRRVALLQQREISEAARARRKEAALERRQALELNDTIVQGLVIAKLSLEVGHQEKALETVNETLETARSIVSTLLAKIEKTDGPVRPGDLRANGEGSLRD